LLIISTNGENSTILVKPDEHVATSAQIYVKKCCFLNTKFVCTSQEATPILLITSSENFSDQFVVVSAP
jgi:hypothetical protein